MFVTNNLSRWKQTKLRGIGAEEVKPYSSVIVAAAVPYCAGRHIDRSCVLMMMNNKTREEQTYISTKAPKIDDTLQRSKPSICTSKRIVLLVIVVHEETLWVDAEHNTSIRLVKPYGSTLLGRHTH